ncbi:hypothetical protein [Diplocloster hominis]|uniref:hypothetical protein n=1 Tax=Diplocloster hominis TaxID=3079010 RepID=UPI0031BB42C4
MPSYETRAWESFFGMVLCLSTLYHKILNLQILVRILNAIGPRGTGSLWGAGWDTPVWGSDLTPQDDPNGFEGAPSRSLRPLVTPPFNYIISLIKIDRKLWDIWENFVRKGCFVGEKLV